MKVLEIKSDDLVHNINKIKERANGTTVIAVLKGNAYGLGLKEFAKILTENEITNFAVSSVEEAVELADMKLDAQILCMEATEVKEELELLVSKNIVITIGNLKTAKLLNKLAVEKKVKPRVHLKIDTGFSRYGFDYQEKEKIVEAILNNENILVDGIYSHFSTAYLEDENYMNLQLARFKEVKNFLESKEINIPIYHIANSSAFLRREDTFFNAVRIGSAFIGRISGKNTIGLKRIGMLKSNVVSIKNIKKGTPIGYSNSVVAKKDLELAIVPIGYADGFNVEIKNDTFKFIDKLRILKNAIFSVFKDDRIKVNINENMCYVLGRVGMNHIAVDITGKDIKINDIVKIDVSPILVSSKIRREYI